MRARYVPILLLACGIGVVLTGLAPWVWPVLLTDGVFVVALLAAAGGWGAWPAVWLGLGRRSAAQQVCAATALGCGVLSAAALALGMVGALGQAAAWGLVVIGGLLGLSRVYLAQGQGPGSGCAGESDRPSTASGAPAATARRGIVLRSLALLPLCVAPAIALFGATLPPGVLWTAEARGYDALEYHLQVPREYFDAGGIQFLPHNVYASFPQQMETLYLLLMHLTGDPLSAAIPAQLLHAAFGVLTVVALVAWAAPGWSRILVALAAGSLPWLAYLGCLAYVELGVLFFAAVAGGLVLDHLRAAACNWRTALAAGLCAGLAGGCKYTAVVLVAAALGVAWLLSMRGGLRPRIARLALFGVGALAALSPWLIRNAAFTGNPVYPFAYKWFGGAAWSAEQATQWAQGHRLPAEKGSLAGRSRILADELFSSDMYGPALWLLALAALALRLSRENWLALVWLAIIIAVWAAWTHMPGRFAVPVVVPLTLMLSRGTATDEQPAPKPWRAKLRRLAAGPLLVLAGAGALWNGATLVDMLRSDGQSWHRLTGHRLAKIVGVTESLREGNPINMAVHDSSAHIWLVGEARAFYVQPQPHYTVAFSRDPWLEFAATGASPAQCVGWLRSRNVTHVVFSWSEIGRLRRTYGFSPLVTREWVAGLQAAGLRRIRPVGPGPDVRAPEIYEVLPE